MDGESSSLDDDIPDHKRLSGCLERQLTKESVPGRPCFGRLLISSQFIQYNLCLPVCKMHQRVLSIHAVLRIFKPRQDRIIYWQFQPARSTDPVPLNIERLIMDFCL